VIETIRGEKLRDEKTKCVSQGSMRRRTVKKLVDPREGGSDVNEGQEAVGCGNLKKRLLQRPPGKSY